MGLVKTTIDGIEVEVPRDTWALDVARDLGIEIPTLCHHPGLEPYGSCRLCLVEVTKGEHTWLTTACDLPIREGLIIRTDTPGVIRGRKMALELLWAQAPEAQEVANLARAMGVSKPRFKSRNEGNKCILCGMCVQACSLILGEPAICFGNRGIQRVVDSPFGASSDVCVGCGACVSVCPTGHIESVISEDVHKFPTWHTELEVVYCESCKRPVGPAKALEHVQKRFGEKFEIGYFCSVCRREETATKLHEITEKIT